MTFDVYNKEVWISYTCKCCYNEPFVVCELVAVVVPGDNVHQEDVLGFRVESRDLHLVTGEHPPREDIEEENITFSCQTHIHQNT